MSRTGSARRLAAIVAADVANYSKLMGADEEGTLAALKGVRDEVFVPKLSEGGGHIVKTTGDGLLIEFASVVDALRCSLDIQHAIMVRNQNLPVERRLLFRVGINLGDVIVDGNDIYGDGVNIAARLEAMADPGGICVSQAVIDQVSSKLEVDFDDLGSRSLKNIDEPVRSYRIRHASPAAGRRPARAPRSDVVPRLPERPAVAIMPFRNVSRDSAHDYIADGIALGIQTLLVQLSGLFLINACSDQAYREGRSTAAEAARNLPVRYALEGAVQTAGQRVRVTAQLSDLRDGSMVWAERYDRDLEDVFSLQDDVTREVISSLGSEMMGGDLDRIRMRSLDGLGAWECYLRMISHIYRFTKPDNARARQMAEQLCDLYPDKMLGPAHVAMTHWLDATHGWSDSRDESIRLAAEWAKRSTASDELNNGLGYVILGSVRLLERQHEEALSLCRKGIGYRTNCPFAIGQLAEVENYCGDAESAVKTAREALTIQMFFPPPLVNVLAMAYRDSGDIGSSIAAAQEAVRLDPEATDAYVTLCSDYALADEDDDARRTAERILDLDPAFSITSYTSKQPYKDASRLSAVADALRRVGLPE